MARIGLQDTRMSAMMKMAEGNPGALSAMAEILKEHDKIDPQAFMGGMGAILSLDTFEIYGSSIYVLWSDKCGRDVRKMLMLMRSVQLGFLPQTKLQEMAVDQMRAVDLTEEEWIDLDSKACNKLDDFERPQ